MPFCSCSGSAAFFLCFLFPYSGRYLCTFHSYSSVECLRFPPYIIHKIIVSHGEDLTMHTRICIWGTSTLSLSHTLTHTRTHLSLTEAEKLKKNIRSDPMPKKRKIDIEKCTVFNEIEISFVLFRFIHNSLLREHDHIFYFLLFFACYIFLRVWLLSFTISILHERISHLTRHSYPVLSYFALLAFCMQSKAPLFDFNRHRP